MSISLMTMRRFAPLFWCQFFAAFGDNFLKTALVFVILYEVAGANSAALISLAGATLIAPFFLLSGLGGELADRYDKAIVAQRIKLTEIGAAVVAVAGFAFHSLALLFLAVAMFGTLASLFGPIKYGILPDLLQRRELPSGNALIEGGTFLAILIGTIVAGIAANGNSNPLHFAWLMILTALASWLASLLIHKIADQATSRRSAVVVGRARCELVLARGRTDSFPLAAACLVHDWRQRRGGDAVSDHLLDRGRDRLGPRSVACRRPYRVAADIGRGRSARTVLARPRLDRFGDRAGANDFVARRVLRVALQFAHRHRPRRSGDRRRSIHRAGVHGDTGLGRRRSSRPRRRRRQRAQCRVHGRRRDHPRRLAKIRVQHARPVRADRRRQYRHSDGDRHDHAGELAARLPLDPVPRLLSARSDRPREHRQSRQQRHHRAQPRQLSRSAAGDVDPAETPGLRHRRHHVTKLVDPAVSQIRAHHGARSAQAILVARHHSGGTRRRNAGHFSRRPHHSDRQPDEGL